MKKIIIVVNILSLMKNVALLAQKIYVKDAKMNIQAMKQQVIKENIDTLEEVIENIKYNLDGTKRIYKRYYNISLDIIKKFETFNKSMKNYRILRTVRNLTFSNKQMLDNLNKIINEKELQNKCSIIIETYLSKENLYKGKSFKNVELENDDNWYEEIQKIKKIKIEKEQENNSEKKRPIRNVQKKKQKLYILNINHW